MAKWQLKTDYELIIDDLYKLHEKKDINYVFKTMEDVIDKMSEEELNLWVSTYNLRGKKHAEKQRCKKN